MTSMANLPVHLMVLILQKLGSEKDYSNAAHMRLVSKDWRAAFAECPGSTTRTVICDTDMEKICALAPSLTQIHIKSRGQPIILAALAECVRLKNVGVSCDATEAIAVDLRGLPGSVKQLIFLPDVHLLPSSFSSLTRLSVETVELRVVRNTFSELDGLLVRLPTLQELCITGNYREPHVFEHITIDSLTALTRIILQDCAFAPPLQCLPQLRRVYLFNVMSRRNWLGPAFAPLSGLTFLGFDCCICLDSRSDEDLMPISSLRTLAMSQSEKQYISCAPATLAVLSIDWDVTDPTFGWQALTPPPITRLTGLTRLEFTFCGQMRNAELLRDLPLRELLLLSCHLSVYEQLLSLFVPGALPLLQKLHIEDDRSAEAGFDEDAIQPCSDTVLAEILEEEKAENELSARRLTAAPYFQSMLTLSDGIVSLPSLQQVSGCSALFDFGMEDELKDWPMRSGIGLNSSEDSPFRNSWAPVKVLKVWCKA